MSIVLVSVVVFWIAAVHIIVEIVGLALISAVDLAPLIRLHSFISVVSAHSSSVVALISRSHALSATSTIATLFAGSVVSAIPTASARSMMAGSLGTPTGSSLFVKERIGWFSTVTFPNVNYAILNHMWLRCVKETSLQIISSVP